MREEKTGFEEQTKKRKKGACVIGGLLGYSNVN
jgi:hypothetical protein